MTPLFPILCHSSSCHFFDGLPLLSTTRQRQAVTKANDLKANGINIEILNMNKAGQTFDFSRFYAEIASAIVRCPSEGSAACAFSSLQITANVNLIAWR